MPDLYVPLDVNFQDDDRLLEVDAFAELMFVRSLAMCKRLLCDGAITRGQARRLGDKFDDWEDAAKQLVAVGLWDETPTGFVVRSWDKHNRTAGEVQDSRERKRSGGSKGNHNKWHRDRGIVNPDCDYCLSDSDSHSDIGTESGSESDGNPHSEVERSEVSDGGDKPKKPRKATQLPKDWTPNDKHDEIARREGVDLEQEATQFRDWAVANGKTYKDWDAGFRTWLRNARKFGGKQSTPKPNGPGGVAL